MLNWKKHSSQARNQASNTMDDAKSYFGGILSSRTLLIIAAAYLVITLIIGWYWSQEPDFSLSKSIQQAAEQAQRPIVTGYTTVETLKQVAATILISPVVT